MKAQGLISNGVLVTRNKLNVYKKGCRQEFGNNA